MGRTSKISIRNVQKRKKKKTNRKKKYSIKIQTITHHHHTHSEVEGFDFKDHLQRKGLRNSGGRQCPAASTVIVAEKENVGDVDRGKDQPSFSPRLALGGE